MHPNAPNLDKTPHISRPPGCTILEYYQVHNSPALFPLKIRRTIHQKNQLSVTSNQALSTPFLLFKSVPPSPKKKKKKKRSKKKRAQNESHLTKPKPRPATGLSYAHLIRKAHQPRIQHDGQQQVTDRNGGHGQDGHKVHNHPIDGHDTAQPSAQRNHHEDGADGKGHAELELLQDAGHFLEESGLGDFLGGGAPGHVVAEHVGEQGRRDVQGEAAEEDGEHQGPFEVFGHWRGRKVLVYGCSRMRWTSQLALLCSKGE